MPSTIPKWLICSRCKSTMHYRIDKANDQLVLVDPCPDGYCNPPRE